MFLQQEKPVDYVLATGKQYSVRDLVTLCFEMVEKPVEWRGEGLSEEGVCKATGQVKVQISPKYFRPTEVDTLLGDPTKAKKEVGWEPECSFKELVYEMMEYDLKGCGLEIPASASAVVKRQDKYC
mmetsp:Transcript_95271/g.251667  ORF Transcript_95271/g.251667 Transcript_95271/m.251667 type:complete len:126 (+) Transcript_95271:2-379(+)